MLSYSSVVSVVVSANTQSDERVHREAARSLVEEDLPRLCKGVAVTKAEAKASDEAADSLMMGGPDSQTGGTMERSSCKTEKTTRGYPINTPCGRSWRDQPRGKGSVESMYYTILMEWIKVG